MFFIFSFTSSLTSFAFSFISKLLLFLGHVTNSKLLAIVYASSQEFVCSFRVSNCSISVLIVCQNFSNSGSTLKCFSILFNDVILSIMISFTSFNNSFPHIVLLKSSSSLSSKLNISIFSFNHFSGNGLLCIYEYIFKTKSFKGVSSL